MSSDENLTALVSIDAEQSVLGSLLIDNGAIDRVASLATEHFSRADHRRIFRAIRRELAAGRPVDVLTVHVALHRQEDLTYLNALAQCVPSSANVRRYAAIVIEHARARTLMAVGSAAMEIAQDATLPVEERIERAQAEFSKLADQAAQQEAVPLGEALLMYTQEVEARAEGRLRAFATGLKELDEQLGGGLQPGTLVVIGARPSMGKTAMAVNFALHIAQKHSALMLQLEMSQSQLNARITSQLGGVTMRSVLRPDLGVDDDFWSRISDAVEIGGRRRLYIDCQSGLTLHQVAAKVRAAKRKHAIDVVVIDYVQLVLGTDPRQPRAYQIADITAGLKSLAKQLDIAVVVLAQVNRLVDGMPGLPDLKDSGSIEQDADVVLFVHRPIQDHPELGDAWRHFAELRVAKNRQGESGVDIRLHYDGPRTLFTTWTGPSPVKPSKVKAARRTNDL